MNGGLKRSTPPGRVTVIGRGVVGLTTSIVLAEAGYEVDNVGTVAGKHTTSAAAGALVGLAFVEPYDRVATWEATTLKVMQELSADPSTGVTITDGVFASEEPILYLPEAIASRPDFERLSGSRAPLGYKDGFALRMPLVDMSLYLQHLEGRLRRTGATQRIGTIDRITDLRHGSVVNCSGLGARTLVPDDSVTPSRGQHLVLRNPGVTAFFMDGDPRQESWTSWFPHGERLIVGGVAQQGNWDIEPDAALAERMLDQATARLPQLRGSAVFEHQVGLRPMRPSVRVERLDQDGMPVVHNYGHGGVGVTLSWGCAQEVERLLREAVD